MHGVTRLQRKWCPAGIDLLAFFFKAWVLNALHGRIMGSQRLCQAAALIATLLYDRIALVVAVQSLPFGRRKGWDVVLRLTILIPAGQHLHLYLYAGFCITLFFSDFCKITLHILNV